MKRTRSSGTTKRPAKKQKTQAQVASEVVQRELKKRIDWKYTDVSSVAGVASTGSVASLLANLVRGTAGFNNFVGNMITPQAITLKYFWQTNQTYNSCRVIVFQWFDDGTPAVTGVIESNATTIGTISPILTTNKPFIKVLHDETLVIAPTAGDAAIVGNGVSPCMTIYIPGKRIKPVRFNSTTNTVQDGNIYILTISDDSVLSFPQLAYYSRVTFSDS